MWMMNQKKRFKTSFLVNRVKASMIGLALLSVGNVAAETSPLSAKIKDQMQQWQQQYQLPSMSLAITVNNQLKFADAIGLADVEKKVAATADTAYSVGSIAKPFTGLALARLVDSGALKLEDSVAQHLVDYPQYKDMTILQLASHTAGVGRPWKARNHREFEAPVDHKSPFEAFDLFVDEPLQFAPGGDFKYTSMGYVLLSAVLQKAANQPYTQIMQETVFSPLGMTHTEFDDSKAGGGREASYYQGVDEQGQYLPAQTPRDRSYLFGGGGYISTPSDMVKLLDAFSQPHFLSPEIKARLQTPVPLNNGEVNEQGYSLGWRVSEVEDPRHPNGKVLAIHHGGVTGDAATAFVLLIPEYRSALAYATNTDPDKFWAVRQQALQLLLDTYHQ